MQITLAKETLTAGDDKRNNNAVTSFQARHATASVFHYTHEFMSQHIAVFKSGYFAAIQMEIGATNGSSRYAQNDVIVCK
jgi:hypothetical protein